MPLVKVIHIYLVVTKHINLFNFFLSLFFLDHPVYDNMLKVYCCPTGTGWVWTHTQWAAGLHVQHAYLLTTFSQQFWHFCGYLILWLIYSVLHTFKYFAIFFKSTTQERFLKALVEENENLKTAKILAGEFYWSFCLLFLFSNMLVQNSTMKMKDRRVIKAR